MKPPVARVESAFGLRKKSSLTYPLKNSAIVDSGASLHIFNTLDRFLNLREANPEDVVIAGDSTIRIYGYGEIDMKIRGPKGYVIYRLYNVAYCPEMATNLVSLQALNRMGVYWENRPKSDLLRHRWGAPLCSLTRIHNQYVMEYLPVRLTAHAFYTRRNLLNSYTGKSKAKASLYRWHQRLGHPGPEPLKRLLTHTEGVAIAPRPDDEIRTTDCVACSEAKAHRRIVREARSEVTEAGARLAIDFHEYDEPNQEGRLWRVMLITDRYSGYTWDYYADNKLASTIQAALEDCIKHISHHFNAKVKIIECDGELAGSEQETTHLSRSITEKYGITFEISPPHTQDLNGGAERVGATIKSKASSMRNDCKLPPFLWTEIVRTAVYLYNRTPKRVNRWRAPYEKFYSYFDNLQGIVGYKRSPSLAHLRVFGCMAFAMTWQAKQKKRRRRKLDPKAWIGYLVGYQSTNTYRIWLPRENKVIVTRDVTFNEDEFFSGDLNEFKDELLKVSSEAYESLIEKITYENASELSEYTRNHLEDDEPSNTLPESALENLDAAEQEEDELMDDVSEDPLKEVYPYTSAEFELGLSTPPESPPAALLSLTISQPNNLDLRLKGERTRSEPQAQAEMLPLNPLQDRWTTCFHSARLHSALYINNELVTKAQRARLLRNAAYSHNNSSQVFNTVESSVSEEELAPEKAYKGEAPERVTDFSRARVHSSSQSQVLNTEDGLASAFHSGISRVLNTDEAAQKRGEAPEPRNRRQRAHLQELLSQKMKIHRRDLPPPPKWHNELVNHPLGDHFREAERTHLQSHTEMGTWKEIPKSSSQKGLTLDCMWVYVYKFDKHGYYSKCKARLVVRGDQQPNYGKEDTYASTLAGRSFRTLMAIAAKFDLELKQYDAVNAFVNAKLTKEVYMRMPPGYRKPETVVQLQRALYGLRESPLLWQRELTKSLCEIGFTPIPHEPCCFSRGGVLLFVYVDDIVVAYKKKSQRIADEAIEALRAKYNLTGGNDLQWFLGVEVIRDRQKGLLWLSQASYIEKIAKLRSSTSDTHASTPMRTGELFPYKGIATPASIHLFQQKVGSILYAAVITRPDIAFGASRLARFNHNPSPEHHRAADRLLSYLLSTQSHALQFGDEDDFVVASDASFGDNTLDRKSSQAYVMKLFGGVIGWRANKQDTVTTSTTEAELLALAQAAKEAMYVNRLINELGVSLDSQHIRIQCDNQQTIGLVTKEIAVLRTKLRHVDIHNHWLRQEIERGSLIVEYTPTDEMIADGLTKALALQKWPIFLTQLGLVIPPQQLKSLTSVSTTTDQLEDQLMGGESTEWLKDK